MAQLIYRTFGTCSREIKLEIEDGIITNVEFFGGCNGNTKGIASLVVGMDAQDAKNKLKGIKCGMRDTSCPDQLSKAIEKYQQENN